MLPPESSRAFFQYQCPHHDQSSSQLQCSKKQIAVKLRLKVTRQVYTIGLLNSEISAQPRTRECVLNAALKNLQVLILSPNSVVWYRFCRHPCIGKHFLYYLRTFTIIFRKSKSILFPRNFLIIFTLWTILFFQHQFHVSIVSQHFGN